MTDDNVRDRRLAYLDLLASTLTQHEKTLDQLIEKLEKISEGLIKVLQKKGVRKRGEIEISARGEEAPVTITYMKIDVNRPTEELTKVLETLMGKSKEARE